MVQQNDIMGQDAIVCSATISPQIREQENGVAGIEELVKPVEDQVVPQAGRINVRPAEHQLGKFGRVRGGSDRLT